MRKFYLAWGGRQNLLMQSFLVLCLFLASSCTARYVYTPTIAELAVDKTNIVLDGVSEKINKTAGIQITDADIFAFTNNVKQAWRNRSQASRTFDVLTGVSRVGLAGAATTVAATKGLGSSGDTIPVLTGIATFIGEIFGLVDPAGRAEAYQDGLKLILDAEAEFVEKVPNGLASGTSLSDAGKGLYKKVVAAIALVDKALQGRIPTKEEVEAATAKIEELGRVPLVLSSDKIEDLQEGKSIPVRVTRGSPIVEWKSSNPREIVTVKVEDKGESVTIIGKEAGETVLTFKNKGGAEAKYGVKVAKPSPG